jgi:hypothetical protein
VTLLLTDRLKIFGSVTAKDKNESLEINTVHVVLA